MISPSKLLSFTRFLIPLLIASILLSCSASQHAGVEKVQEPPISEKDESIWFSYYQDQFDSKEGNVTPPSTQYSPAAIQAYDRAKVDWDKKSQAATTNTVVAYVGMCLAGAAMAYLVFSSIFSGGTSGPFFKW